MNDIPHGTSRATLINSLLSPENEDQAATKPHTQADVQFGLLIRDSRLDDELSVAEIEFSNTPPWLQKLNKDQCGFPKRTPFGTFWRGVDPNAVDERGQSEFIRAVVDGARDLYYPEMMAEFDDTNDNLQDKQGRTALHWACLKNLCVMVKLCLSVPDCDVGLRDDDGFTAFDLAPNDEIRALFYSSIFQMEKTEQQESLLRLLTLTSVPAGPDRLVFPGAALLDSVEHRNPRLVAALIARTVELTARNEHGNTALHVAAAQVDGVQITQMLVDAGADVNALGNGGATPLHCAARAGQLQIAKLLLENGALVGMGDGSGATALQLAEDKHHQGVVDLLKGARDINQGAADQMEAVKPQDPTVAIMADIESRNERGRTALQQAVFDKDLDRVSELLLRGADIESRTTDDLTALMIAVSFTNMDFINTLLEAGADVRAANGAGLTALHLATLHGYADITKALLNEGADTEAVSTAQFYMFRSGSSLSASYTALHAAVFIHNVETLKALVQGGADLNATDSSGVTIVGYALRQGDLHGLKFLRDAGAPFSASESVRYLALRARKAGQGY